MKPLRLYYVLFHCFFIYCFVLYCSVLYLIIWYHIILSNQITWYLYYSSCYGRPVEGILVSIWVHILCFERAKVSHGRKTPWEKPDRIFIPNIFTIKRSRSTGDASPGLEGLLVGGDSISLPDYVTVITREIHEVSMQPNGNQVPWCCTAGIYIGHKIWSDNFT